MPPWLASNEFWPAARIRTPNEVNRKTSTSATVRMTANALISSDATLNVAPKILAEPFESPGIVIVYCVCGKTMPMTPWLEVQRFGFDDAQMRVARRWVSATARRDRGSS